MISLIALNTIVLLVLLVLFAGSFLLAYRQREEQNLGFPKWALNWLPGMSHELAGAVLTGLLFLVLVTVPEAGRQEAEYKAALVRGMRVGDLAAIQELKDLGWLYDGTLHGTSLTDAELEGVNLLRTRLEGADLLRANLEDAILSEFLLGRSDPHQG